ncbi:MAG: hypothetical protein Q9190_005143 [Brigantiaea leucoxantha]
MKQPRAHLLVMYERMPPNFLILWKLHDCQRLLGLPPSAATASAAVAAAAILCVAMELCSADSTAGPPSPVASAITPPAFCKPRTPSMWSGTVLKAKEPARAIIRGTAMRNFVVLK